MSTKLILPGKIVTAPTPEPGLSRFVNVEVVRAQEIDGTDRGGPTEENVLENANPDDVIELEYSNGVTEWTSVALLQSDLGQSSAARGDGDDVLRIPVTPFLRDRSRGVLGWVLKGLKVFKVDPVEALASTTAQAIVAKFEAKLDPPPGFYRLADPDNPGEQITSANSIDPAHPALIFIHGTASSISGSFGRLAGTEEWQKLRAFYKEQIFGFQHATLSSNPVENALELGPLLPAGGKIHLVTHSRGGLVGELLCLGALSEDD